MNFQAILPAALLATMFFIPGCDEKPVVTATPPIPVETIPVTRGEIRKSLTQIAEAKAYDSVDLVARVEGYLRKRHFEEGSSVKKGELLLELEPEIYEAQVKSAEADLDRATAKRVNAQADFDRQKKLRNQDATSERTYENAEAANLAAEAEIKSAQAALDLARQNLSYTRITAPFDGWIGLCNFSEGNLVNLSSGTLAKLVKIDPMRVEFVIPEKELLTFMDAKNRKLTADDIEVTFIMPDGREFSEKGKISFWDNQINSNTGTFKMQALFPNPGKMLLPGMFGRIRLAMKKSSDSLLIPEQAIQSDQSGEYVYVLGKDGIVVRRDIKTGFIDQGRVEVLSGLEAGEQVIESGAQKVRPGARAVAKHTAEPPATAKETAPAATSAPAPAAGDQK